MDKLTSSVFLVEALKLHHLFLVKLELKLFQHTHTGFKMKMLTEGNILTLQVAEKWDISMATKQEEIQLLQEQNPGKYKRKTPLERFKAISD